MTHRNRIADGRAAEPDQIRDRLGVVVDALTARLARSPAGDGVAHPEAEGVTTASRVGALAALGYVSKGHPDAAANATPALIGRFDAETDCVVALLVERGAVRRVRVRPNAC